MLKGIDLEKIEPGCVEIAKPTSDIKPRSSPSA
jgi:hypothetical protein